MPNLIQIDISKANRHECSSIDLEKSYIVKIDGQWYAGKFCRQWYGLNFNYAPNSVGIQFDAPGYNSSSWEEVYEIVE